MIIRKLPFTEAPFGPENFHGTSIIRNKLFLTGLAIPEAGMCHRLFRPLPPYSSPLNSTLINLAAQLAFFILYGKELQAGLQVAHR